MPLVFPCLTLLAVSDIPVFLPQPLLCVTHSSSTKSSSNPQSHSSLASTLIPSLLNLSSSASSRCQWEMVRIVLELPVLTIFAVMVGTGPGWLADLHQAQMTQAGVRWWGKPRGGDCGNRWECGGVCENLPQLRKEYAGSNQTVLALLKILILFDTSVFKAC